MCEQACIPKRKKFTLWFITGYTASLSVHIATKFFVCCLFRSKMTSSSELISLYIYICINCSWRTVTEIKKIIHTSMTEAMASKNGTGHVKTNSKTNYSAYTWHPEVGNSTSTRSSHCVPLPVQLSGCLPGLGVGSWLHHETGSGTQCAAGPLCPSRRFRISVINKTRT